MALSKDVELSRPLKPAVIVLLGSKAENAESLGRRFAYMRSNMTLSKISRTKSMAVVCYAARVGWRSRIGVGIESGAQAGEAARSRARCREADVVGSKQAWCDRCSKQQVTRTTALLRCRVGIERCKSERG